LLLELIDVDPLRSACKKIEAHFTTFIENFAEPLVAYCINIGKKNGHT